MLMFPKCTSLRGQLLLWLLLPLTLLWLAGSIVAYSLVENFSAVAYDRSLFDSARALATQVKIVDDHIVVVLPQVAQDILRYDEFDQVYFQVSTPDGKIIAGDTSITPPPGPLRETGKSIFHDASVHGHPARIASFYYIPNGSNDEHKVLVQVAETLVKRDKLAKEILSGVILPQLALILLAAISVWFGVGRGLATLNRVQHAISSRSHRDLSPVGEKDAPQEIRPLMHAINDLMARLGTVLTSQQRFIADAAHQLRTPLAGLKTQTEYALRQTDPASIQHALQQLAASTERTIRLTNQLLALARAEPEAIQSSNMIPLDLAELSRTATMEWVPEALGKNIDLGYEGSETPVFITGDAFLLKEMIGNLLDNAIRYTQQNGKVTVRLSADHTHARLSIEDNGPGIPQTERDRVFERFHRVLGSGAEGSGLGLSIVREIVLAHEGQVYLSEAQEQTGTRLEVVFPVYLPG